MRRSTPLVRLTLALFLLAAVPLLTSGWVPPVFGTRVVVLVRHAEVQDASADPVLSAAGRARAATLAGIAARYEVEAAYTTPFIRTNATAAPAAEWLGLKPEVVPVAAGVPAHVADVAERVRRAPGGAALVLGHSTTVPAIVQAHTGQTVAPISETQFNRLFVVTLPPAGAATVTERTY